MIILILLVIFLPIVWYYVQCLNKSNYWKSRGIPSPKGELLWGHRNMVNNPEYPGVLQIRDWTKKFGKVFGIREGWRQVLITSDPEMIYEMLVKKFDCFYGRKLFAITYNPDRDPRGDVFNGRGARWKRLRSIASPTMNVNNLKKVLPILENSIDAMLEHLDKNAKTGQAFNIHPYFRELTMDIISRVAMGQPESRQFQNPDVERLKEIINSIGMKWNFWLADLFPWDWCVYLFNKLDELLDKFNNNAGFSFFYDLVMRIEERKRLRTEGQLCRDSSRCDFIDILLDAETEEEVSAQENGEYSHKSTIKVSKRLTTEEIVGMCTVFLFAGFDTTANTLANMVYFLAKNHEKQRLLQKEIDQICQDETISYEQLQSMKYADAVMKESQRLVPIAGFVVARECMESITLGNIPIEKGTLIQADVYTVHHSKELWGEDADKFVPERFLSNETRQPSAFLAFGGGPRVCMGVRLAQLEDKLAIVKLLKEYDILECDQTEKELKMISNGVLQPESVTIKLRKRQF